MKMKEFMHRQGRHILYGALLLFLVINLFYWGGRKEGYYCDELYSYHFVCQVDYPSINGAREGVSWLNAWYTPDYFMDYFTITEDEAFDFSGTWQSIRQDVHPPVFYILLEMVCSMASFILPGVFSKWFGICINIVFFIMTIVVLYLLAKRVTKSELWAIAVCVVYGISTGAVSTVVFIRMYMIFTFSSALFVYLNAVIWEKLWKQNAKIGAGLYCALAATTILGILNHYYFIVYAFFICAAIWGSALLWKKFRFMLEYALAMVLGILCSLLIWPEMITDIFRDYRGEEAFNNLAKNTALGEAVTAFLGLINGELFGGCIGAIILLFAVGVILRGVKNKWEIERTVSWEGVQYHFERKEVRKRMEFEICPQDLFWLQMVIATALYVFLIAKIAPYREDRYIFNVYPIIVLAVAYMGKKIFIGANADLFWSGVVIGGMLLTAAAGYITPGVNYLFKGTNWEMEVAESYSHLPTFYITETNSRYRVCGDSVYLSKAQHIYPIKEDGIDGTKNALEEIEMEKASQFLVYIDLSFQDMEEVLEKVMRELDCSQVEQLYKTEYSIAYVIE